MVISPVKLPGLLSAGMSSALSTSRSTTDEFVPDVDGAGSNAGASAGSMLNRKSSAVSASKLSVKMLSRSPLPKSKRTKSPPFPLITLAVASKSSKLLIPSTFRITRSLPSRLKLEMVSRPSPVLKTKVSSPAKPSSRSSPRPPARMSLPSPPRRKSLPSVPISSRGAGAGSRVSCSVYSVVCCVQALSLFKNFKSKLMGNI